MKSYLNPQPSAVERINKVKEKSRHVSSKDEKNEENSNLKKSDEEIFKNESEEQAWRDVLKKHKS